LQDLLGNPTCIEFLQKVPVFGVRVLGLVTVHESIKCCLPFVTGLIMFFQVERQENLEYEEETAEEMDEEEDIEAIIAEEFAVRYSIQQSTCSLGFS